MNAQVTELQQVIFVGAKQYQAEHAARRYAQANNLDRVPPAYGVSCGSHHFEGLREIKVFFVAVRQDPVGFVKLRDWLRFRDCQVEIYDDAG